MTKSFTLEGIGPIKMTKSSRFRNIKITIRPFNGVNVSIPPSLSFKDAEQFIQTKKNWIKSNVEKVHDIEKKQTVFDEATTFRTKDHQLKIVPHNGHSIKLIIKNNIIYVFYPAFADVKDPRIQNAVRKAIIEAWRIEAKRYLPSRVDHLAKKYCFSYQKVTFKNASTRWGSCSALNNINLNVQLIRLPQHLCDYIILHELAHTIHKNHGKKFWGLLDKITGDARKLDKEMRKYNLSSW